MGNENAKVKITLTRSLIARKPNQKRTAASIGLRKIGDTAVLTNDCALMGKIKVLSHLVSVEKAEQ